MSDFVSDARASTDTSNGTPAHSFNYPWAAAPDIIRSHQKDAYFQSVLLTQLSSVIRALYGARTAHNWTGEARTATELLYLGLTTFIGNRTLGEEYCDIVQVEDDSGRLPSISRRSGYILSSILLPHLLTRFLPVFRRRLRAKLEISVRKGQRQHQLKSGGQSTSPNCVLQLQEYVLKHLDHLTSPAPVYAVGLAVFYFSGAYYELSKRVFGLRYIFTRKLTPSDQRAGYEVLGILLVLQMAVQGWLHASETFAHIQHVPSNNAAVTGSSVLLDGGVEVTTEGRDYSAPLLFEASPQGADPAAQKERIAAITHTPSPTQADGCRYNLENEQTMPWIDGSQQRKCTLCLEPMKDPSATTCGHVFCWTCVTDWLREQPMCPLCRQNALVQHVLPLRG